MPHVQYLAMQCIYFQATSKLAWACMQMVDDAQVVCIHKTL